MWISMRFRKKTEVTEQQLRDIRSFLSPGAFLVSNIPYSFKQKSNSLRKLKPFAFYLVDSWAGIQSKFPIKSKHVHFAGSKWSSLSKCPPTRTHSHVLKETSRSLPPLIPWDTPSPYLGQGWRSLSISLLPFSLASPPLQSPWATYLQIKMSLNFDFLNAFKVGTFIPQTQYLTHCTRTVWRVDI